ncbi:MAG: DUF6286 domain-containing protein [Pseudonocardia sp.]|nr:DUF6286 domain-containing protein [Pseudonocardia sp.]
MRVLLRVIAPLLGLALAAAGALLAIEVVAAWTRIGAPAGVLVPWPTWRAALESTTWSEPPVAWIAIGVAVVGLLLVLVGAGARRSDITVAAPQLDMTVTTSPRVVARLIGQRVRRADDVARAGVTASRRRITVAAQGWADLDDTARKALCTSMEETVSAVLDDLAPARRPRVAVRLAPPKGQR